jgi:microcystin-dependent protein
MNLSSLIQITTNKIADGAVTASKLAAGAIPAAIPSGAIMPFAMNSAPSGWLAANGAAVSRTTYSGLFQALVTSSGFTSQTVTFTAATAGVFTKTAHGFVGGERLRISTTGTLPPGLNTTTDYFVEVITTNTFYLLTAAGARVNTTGTGVSGVHSYTQSWHGLGDGSTTFNLPDLRGYFVRGVGTNGDSTASGIFAAKQADAFESHSHSLSGGGASGNFLTKVSANTRNDLRADGGSSATNGVSTTSANVSYTQPSVGSAGGAETRPANIAMLYCIKF